LDALAHEEAVELLARKVTAEGTAQA
jgi:hypothetical protein